MKQYRVMLWIPKTFLVNASSEDEVIEILQTKVLEKPSDPYKINIIEESEIENNSQI